MGKKVLMGLLKWVTVFALLAAVPMGTGGTVNAARRTLKEPSKDSHGVVTWDCVYFGNYPQSDATGRKKEPIKWRVLSVKGNDAFLVADRNLDAQKYHDQDVDDITWETCTMRSWLNGYGKSSNVCGKDYSKNSFLSRAFTISEQGAIKRVTVVNADNPHYGTEGGSSTKDKIFLLSYDEVTNPAYGFLLDCYEYDNARKRKNTAYVAGGGTSGSKYMNAEGVTDWWWLRSPGEYLHDAMEVHCEGGVRPAGNYVISPGGGVCPALHLDLSFSKFWLYAGTVSSDGTSTGCPHEKTEFRGKREANCMENGYTGDMWCNDCGGKIKEGEVIPGGHQWDDGKVTKPATANENAVKTFTCTVCGETRAEEVLGTADLVNVSAVVQTVTDDSITAQSSEDIKGASFNVLRARSTKLTDKSITLRWNQVLKADGYKIYGNRCGKKNHYKLIKDLGKEKNSYTQKKLKKGTYYKYVVAAYKIADGKKVTIAVSKTIHAATTGGRYGVAKAVKVNKSKVTLKKGKKFTIKAKEIKKDKPINHHRKIAYESDKPEVAAVSKKGVIKAKKKGNCYIYVYAQNGVYKKIKLTVK